MKYVVRSADGELEYETFEQLREAASLGFVEPNDQVKKEGSDEWKRAGDLVPKMNRRKSVFMQRSTWWVLAALVLAGGALFALLKRELIIGGSLILPLAAVLIQLQREAAKIKK